MVERSLDKLIKDITGFDSLRNEVCCCEFVNVEILLLAPVTTLLDVLRTKDHDWATKRAQTMRKTAERMIDAAMKLMFSFGEVWCYSYRTRLYR